MTSNGPHGPDPAAGQPGDQPFEATAPAHGSFPPPGGQTPQPGYTQPAPGNYAPPAQPGGYQPPTQAVPDYAPPSTADYQANPFGQATTPGDEGSKRGGQRALLAGVLGGLVTLAAITGGFLLFGSGDDPEPEDPPPIDVVPEEPDEEEPEGPEIDERIGSSVTGLELQAGDCINYDNTVASIETFDIVTCGTPHLAEISAVLPHPDASGPYPGVDELLNWSATPCQEASSEYLGTDVLATTFVSNTLLPDLDEWNEGLTSVSCLIQATDDARIIESVAGRGTSYERDTEVAVNRLRAGDCFLPTPPQNAFDLAADDIVMLAPCNDAHDGLFFGRGDLVGATGAPYPGIDQVDEDSIEICDAAFESYFGVPAEGLNYRYWTPSESRWTNGERMVHCAVLDEQGLPTSLNYLTFDAMFRLPIGQCFVFGPEESVETLRLDDWVDPVDCSQPHNGEVFGLGELPPTSDPFPGDDAADQQIQETCIDLFTSYVGISPFDSANGDFRYWFPSEAGWESGDLRWACALVTDETQTGSIAGTNA